MYSVQYKVIEKEDKEEKKKSQLYVALECGRHCWPTEKPASTSVTSLAANHVHCNVQNQQHGQGKPV